MSGKYDLMQSINISWKWDEESVPRNSNFLVQRNSETGDVEILINNFEADMIGSAEECMLKALVKHYMFLSKKIGYNLVIKVVNHEISEGFLKQLGFLLTKQEEIWDKGYLKGSLYTFVYKY